MTKQEEVAELLNEFADLLEAKEVEYKPRAYRDAAESVATADKEDLQDPTSLDGVGEAIGSKITEYLETGEIQELNELRDELPIDIQGITAIEGIGPKTAAKLYRELGVKNLDDLERKAREGAIEDVPGFGEKTQQRILEGIEFAKKDIKRMLLGDAHPLSQEIKEALSNALRDASEIITAGSLRRWKETIGDIDIVLVTEGEVTKSDLTGIDDVTDIIQIGEKKASIRFRDTRTDIHIVNQAEMGSSLQYFTGSKNHNVELRNHAIDQGYKLNEYGLWRDNERIAGSDEEGIYNELGLEYIEPELRENTGEIRAAKDNDLPDLVTQSDIQGDLHMHTTRTDGNATINEMRDAAIEMEYSYIALTEHTRSLGVAGGLDVDEIHEFRDDVMKANEETSEIELLCGVEANILKDGSLDIEADVLDELDIVIASVHGGLKMDESIATQRLITGIREDCVDILGHPSGRLIHRRKGYPYDFDVVLDAAIEENVALEVNSNPSRLDITDTQIRKVVDEGGFISINTDAHTTDSLEYMKYGVATARRGWCEPHSVINCMQIEELLKWIDT